VQLATTQRELHHLVPNAQKLKPVQGMKKWEYALKDIIQWLAKAHVCYVKLVTIVHQALELHAQEDIK
jgi:hypothetical protein